MRPPAANVCSATCIAGRWRQRRGPPWRTLVLPDHDLVREVRQGVARGRWLQLHNCVEGEVSLRHRQVLGAREAVARLDQLQGLIHITWLVELAVDQNLQARELLGGEEHRRGGQARLQVGQSRLAQGTEIPFKIEHIVHKLECEADMLAVRKRDLLHLVVMIRQHHRRLARVGHKTPCLVVIFVEIILERRHILQMAATHLHHLALHEVLNHG
mmetsp:Transcript_77142/g.221711  ORF Transcript_77142/g.221711 Transcript_77142/m.221711 type:complete len:214 (-) Transcript_77142:4233-4874(-)